MFSILFSNSASGSASRSAQSAPQGPPLATPGEGLLPDSPMQGTDPACKKQFFKTCLGRCGRCGICLGCEM